MSLSIHLLGVPRVLRDGQVLAAPRGHKVWGLLAYLLRCPVPASRAELAALLFEDAEDPLAALRWNLSELRKLLDGAGPRGEQLALELPPGSAVDLEIVLRGTWAQAVQVPGLERELLEGLRFGASPSFDVWLANERRLLRATAEAVLHEAALARLAGGAEREATAFATRLVRSNPLDENYQALLVRSLAAAGDGVAAARQAAACAELFERELGIKPGAAMQAAIRTATAAPIARPATGRAAAKAQLEAGEAAISAGALEAGLQCLRRAIVEADSTGDPVLRTRARVALGSALVHAARGRDEEGATALHEALAVGQSATPALAAAACRELGYVEFLRGRYERALKWLEQARALASSDRAELARIAIVRGSTLSDTAHYEAALATLREAHAMTEDLGDAKQASYALSMIGRVHLMRHDFDAATEALARSLELARRHWTAFVPWPQSLWAEVRLLRGEVDLAAEHFAEAFALGCQLGDPCWEGIAGRGLGRVAMLRGQTAQSVETLADTISRCARLPDAYVWGKVYALELLCSVAVQGRLPQAPVWVDELEAVAAHSGMREFSVRARMHRAALGDATAAAAARALAREIDNAALAAHTGR
ncbi:BTAD domain-containing putative transcriptional regulator [Variovorax sp. OV329]|uniref:BTAD domain-containing putative transcriptional regulator n=1 Tax=Variovorax sp. OV329 TaxID=1882825 RepID=UPI0008E6CD36|nr:BTAD domain-containing putative transcriptional regulator [Variovorax sp. OV329]SFM83543.1 DNA-binding transcriptional activator of the SARP family [Variovorax sp. OV329]